MQPAPRGERIVVDPRPGNNKKIMLPKPNPKGTKKGGVVNPLPIDDRIYRTMPITEKQLGTIKKYYGIK